MFEPRLTRLFGVFAAAMCVLAGRAFMLQVVTRDTVLAEHHARINRRFVLTPRRGDILFADGSPAAIDEPGWSVQIDPASFHGARWRCGICGAVTRKTSEPSLCRECGSDAALALVPLPRLADLAQLLRVSLDEVETGFVRATDGHVKHPSFRYHELLKDVSRDAATDLALAWDRFPGVIAKASPRRRVDTLAGGVAGHVSGPHPEDVTRLTDANRENPYSKVEVFAMRFGRRGLEAAFDAQLGGEPGRGFRLPPRAGKARSPKIEKPVVDGSDIHTTLSRGVQSAAEEIVADAPGDAAAVVVGLQDGAVLAIASKSKDGLNHAVSGLPPGSVFKLVTGLALLDAGQSTAETVTCEGEGPLPGGQRYRCPRVHGTVDFSAAFAHSCNAYFRTMGDRVGVEALEQACVRLGLGASAHLHLAGSKAGLERSPGPGRHWPAQHVGQISIGMGEVLASPLQIAVAYGRVATGGRLLEPYIVEAERPVAALTDPVIARYAHILNAAARRVVTEGTAARVQTLLDVGAAGKSGTRDDPNASANNAWFVAFAPYGAPRYVAVVVYEKVPGHGSDTAGGHVGRLLAEALR